MYRKYNKYLVLFAVVVLVCLTAGIATAATVTQSITYQGKLTNAAGSPLTGSYSVTFKIYDASTGGTALSTDTHSVTATNGLFTTPITVTDPTIVDGRALWLGIKVGADPEMTPREEIRPVPYALSLRPGATINGSGLTNTKIFSARTTGANNVGIFGESTSGAGVGGSGQYGVYGWGSPSGIGIVGDSFSNIGVEGDSNTGTGVKGWSGGPGGKGVYGTSTGSSGSGVYGESTDTGVKGSGNIGVNGTGSTTGVSGYGKIGVNGTGSTTGVSGYGKIGVSGKSSDGMGVDFTGVFGEGKNYGVHGRSSTGYGISGESTYNTGVNGESSSGEGVRGISDSAYGIYGFSSSGGGVYGECASGDGVTGWSTDQFGVSGYSTNNVGVFGHSTTQVGVKGKGPIGLAGAAYSGGTGLVATDPGDGTGKAAIFQGNVVIQNSDGNTNLLEFGEGLDYSEGFDILNKGEVTPGTVLVISPDDSGSLTISSEPYDRKVAGIVAGANGLGSAVKVGGDQFDTSVALAGRVYCNVDATYGAVKAGDQLTTSATPGYAMVVQDYTKAQGATIGKAMQGLEQGQKGQILVLVTLQ